MAISLPISACRRERRARRLASSRSPRVWLLLACVSALLVASAVARAETPATHVSAKPQVSPPPAASAASSASAPSGPPIPADPLGELIHGNADYLKGKAARPRQVAPGRKDTAQ